MKIVTPVITDFDIEDIATWSGNRLIELHMATLPSKPFARFFPWNKNALNLGYQKLRPRYEPMDEITQTACEPLCPEGWYFDCETETCKEFEFHPSIAEHRLMFLVLEAKSRFDSLPIGNGEQLWILSEGYGYNDYYGSTIEILAKSTSCSRTGWSTFYRPAGDKPFTVYNTLLEQAHQYAKNNAIHLWINDMLAEIPNAIHETDYSSLAYTKAVPNEPSSTWYALSALKICHAYYFTNLPARYLGQERELAISILRSKYGFQI